MFLTDQITIGILNAVSVIVLKILLTVMEIMCVLKHLSPLSCNTGQFSLPENRTFYHINYGAIRGFPALRKFVTTHVKKNNTFSRVFDIANQLLKRHSPFAPLMLMNEEQSLHHS